MRTGSWLKNISRRLTGTSVIRELTQYQSKLDEINTIEPRFIMQSDGELRQSAQQIKAMARSSATLDSLLPEVFALVRETANRTIGLRPYDVQIIGGIGLHEGKLIQMQTGEGKTLAAVSPICLNALNGDGVHVLTFNDYLARRDAEWMGPIYRLLGLTVGFVDQHMGIAERKDAYAADVTYLTAKEAGFDFLRDDLVYEIEALVQRPFNMALVDEADSILVDEARIPLVLAGAEGIKLRGQERMSEVVAELIPDIHYAVAKGGRSVYLTEEGGIRCEQLIGCQDLYSDSSLHILTELNLALHAHVLVIRDVDYIVRHDRVEIVDDFTGRVTEDRHWPHGLQTAIEIKEGLDVSEDARILRSITIQNFLLLYPRLAGMTATAQPAVDELRKFYDLEVLIVPPNRPCIRNDHADVVFADRADKHQALIAEIESVHSIGRPVLVGTITVEESELIASSLVSSGITCSVLNAKRDDEEARTVAEAGDIGVVTISTNMAGRGTDIKLGGEAGERYDQVKSLGGLFVLGTNRHESRRIDYQLRGRAGRQGDPGSSRFFVSLEDDLLVRYGLNDRVPQRTIYGERKDTLNSKVLRRAIAHSQRVIEGQNFDIRDALWRFSRIVEYQRRNISEKRREILWMKTDLTLLREYATSSWDQAIRDVGEAVLRDIERRLTLLSIDECWSEHIERVGDIQESVHLSQIGGLDPMIEYQKEASSSFEYALSSIDERIVEKFQTLDLSSGEADFNRMGLRGPFFDLDVSRQRSGLHRSSGGNNDQFKAHRFCCKCGVIVTADPGRLSS